jgi:hypothetical protein
MDQDTPYSRDRALLIELLGQDDLESIRENFRAEVHDKPDAQALVDFLGKVFVPPSWSPTSAADLPLRF